MLSQGFPNLAACLKAFVAASQLWRPSPCPATSSSIYVLLPFSLRSAGVEQLMYIKEDLIIPHVSPFSLPAAQGGSGRDGGLGRALGLCGTIFALLWVFGLGWGSHCV